MHRNDELFFDADFPTTRENLFGPASPDAGGEVPDIVISWKRPHELSSNAQMFVDGASRGDVTQGLIGDCWFLSACSAIAQKPELLNKVIPVNQVLSGKDYTGKLTFNFWSMGEWVTIQIDDRLPVDEQNCLVNASCTDRDEFWLPLLEKAFAKFHGSYHNLDGGHLVEGFVNLTGYIVENVLVASYKRNKLFQRLLLEHQNNSLLTCSRASQYTQGLVGDHGYTISDVKKLYSNDKLVRMVRVRNPWGRQEWTGAWCDGDSRWMSIKQDVKDDMKFNRGEDGEFWMKFSHFMNRFLEVCVATRIPDLGDNYMDGTTKKLFVIHDSWRRGISAGGSVNNYSKFATNPQYLLTVFEADDVVSDPEENEGEESLRTCEVVVDLIQDHRRSRHRELDALAVHVLKTQKTTRLTGSDFEALTEVEEVKSTEYESISSVMCRVSLEPGEKYVLVPATFYPDIERKFLLRICSHKVINVQAL